MIYGAALAGSSMSIATPKEFQPDKKVVKEAKKSTDIELTLESFPSSKKCRCCSY